MEVAQWDVNGSKEMSFPFSLGLCPQAAILSNNAFYRWGEDIPFYLFIYFWLNSVQF
jgi:hypothetical protein